MVLRRISWRCNETLQTALFKDYAGLGWRRIYRNRYVGSAASRTAIDFAVEQKANLRGIGMLEKRVADRYWLKKQLRTVTATSIWRATICPPWMHPTHRQQCPTRRQIRFCDETVRRTKPAPTQAAWNKQDTRRIGGAWWNSFTAWPVVIGKQRKSDRLHEFAAAGHRGFSNRQ